ncbi:4-hydroxy-tetrahydrodipicolinate synthase [Williamwhitmania taraxaci]|uniref:4-hydroxy-tetrahydrodipicolinate synthase n=1 Tax=Williamwhitmania taraxaci TaxID=1640674 RepID=A0A1G6J5T0_9BACT|nr:4-hydroxy-tetrahydrodipicolinate synthase [Williamwhitmania taraxaci]SDC13326.1 4-hydroxy-tetrahydrodipicolinate synthase [Williamwhitmania taraxaci]
MAKFFGTGVAMITPFNADKSVDFEGLGKLVDYLTKGGVEFLVVLGTTGEAATLSIDERHKVVRYVVEKNAGKLPIVVGIGGNNTAEVVHSVNTFDLSGVDAILSVTPFYNKPNQRGLYEHFKAIALASKLPIILYNVPGRTGINMNAETTIKLAKEFKNIVGIKEASGNLTQITYILRDKPAGFAVLSGDDGLALPQMAMGMDGIISVTGNCLPREFSDMVRYSIAGDMAKARPLHNKFVEIIDALFADGNPAGAKAALSFRSVAKNELRLPLVPVNDPLQKKIEQLMAEFK